MKNGATHYRLKPGWSSAYELLKRKGGNWLVWQKNEYSDFVWKKIDVKESDVFQLITKHEYEQQLTEWFKKNLFGDMVDSAFVEGGDFEDFENDAVKWGISDFGFNPLSSIESTELHINAITISVKLKNGKIVEFGSSEFGGISIKDNES